MSTTRDISSYMSPTVVKHLPQRTCHSRSSRLLPVQRQSVSHMQNSHGKKQLPINSVKALINKKTRCPSALCQLGEGNDMLTRYSRVVNPVWGSDGATFLSEILWVIPQHCKKVDFDHAKPKQCYLSSAGFIL